MVKLFLCAFVLLAFICQLFNRALIITSYYANTASYAKNCENKAKPMLHCNGKCQMLKKIRSEEKKDQENPERRAENKNELVLSSKSFYPSVKNLTTGPAQFITAVSIGILSSMPHSVFHPPTA